MGKKLMTVLGQVWGQAERKFKENCAKRMYLFDVLVESVLMYQWKIWVGDGCKEFEGIQEKYIK